MWREAKMVAWVEQWKSPPKTIYIFENTIQLFLKERPEDTVQQPGYIYVCKNSASHEWGEIQAMALRDMNAPLLQLPGGRKGVRVGRERREHRTAKYPALVICTGSTDTQCMVCWILGKWKSKIWERSPQPAPLGQKKSKCFFKVLKGQGPHSWTESSRHTQPSSWESQGSPGALTPYVAAQLWSPSQRSAACQLFLWLAQPLTQQPSSLRAAARARGGGGAAWERPCCQQLPRKSFRRAATQARPKGHWQRAAAQHRQRGTAPAGEHTQLAWHSPQSSGLPWWWPRPWQLRGLIQRLLQECQ